MDVTVEKAFFESGDPALALKIQEPSFEVNVWFSPNEIKVLDTVLSTSWEDGAIKSGKSANCSVFWSSNTAGSAVNLLVGNDDETWDIGINLSLNDFFKILNELKET